MYPTLPGEEARLEALRESGLIGGPVEPGFERLAELVARALGFDRVAINFVGEDTQWTAAGVGARRGDTVPREHSFCAA